ncbi:hypothetical protein M3I53_18220 [Paraburkholderia sp. CNPSo 3272]|uniref:hypothetical protein n=1 Tax=Paraburkholderia sp. CNPSo 3272 TaxID=2940931 RepID=UPI0020B8D8F8|nr:hypothetical protein [Paraburkholderia sp. CNPSo 3272]MCP3725037.1 hypothetical protein [Paraburkholderia sp. CNPSo 3272]
MRLLECVCVRFVYHLAQALRYACGNLGESAIGLTVAGSLAPAQSITSALITSWPRSVTRSAT